MRIASAVVLLVLTLGAAQAGAEPTDEAFELDGPLGRLRVFLADEKTQIEGSFQGREFSSHDRERGVFLERVGPRVQNGKTILRFEGPRSTLVLVENYNVDSLPPVQRVGLERRFPGVVRRHDGQDVIPTAVLRVAGPRIVLVGGFGSRIPLR